MSVASSTSVPQYLDLMKNRNLYKWNNNITLQIIFGVSKRRSYIVLWFLRVDLN